MNKFLLFLFFSISVFSQQEKDTTIVYEADDLFVAKDSIKKTLRQDLISDLDLKTMDSLLIEEKFNSALIDTLEYVIADKDIVGNSKSALTTALLKQRLSLLNDKTPL